MLEGVIIKGVGGLYTVNTNEGRFACRARGIFRKDEITPLVGDKVLIRIVDKSLKEGYIHSILIRRNELVRPKVTNVDQVCLVFSCEEPSPDFDLIDSIILSCLEKNINVVLCENKIDLDKADYKDRYIRPYKSAGFETFMISALDMTDFKKLIESFQDNITVFAGQSGVGKSSIINNIMQSEVMETGKISERNKRGKHTTRHTELIELKNGGYIIDTPGFSNFELNDIEYTFLDEFYPEFEEYLYKCKYSGCSHIHEPGCKIIEAVKSGKIDKGRYDRYVLIYNKLKVKDENKYK